MTPFLILNNNILKFSSCLKMDEELDDIIGILNQDKEAFAQ